MVNTWPSVWNTRIIRVCGAQMEYTGIHTYSMRCDGYGFMTGCSARAPRLWSEWMVVYSVKTLVLEYVYYTSDLISNGIRGIRIHHLGRARISRSRRLGTRAAGRRPRPTRAADTRRGLREWLSIGSTRVDLDGVQPLIFHAHRISKG